jgi:hypothetical protein
MEERLNAVDNMTRYCGYPSPWWLHLMIIKLYKQMTKIRIHAEMSCRKTYGQTMTSAPPFKFGTTEFTPIYSSY